MKVMLISYLMDEKICFTYVKDAHIMLDSAMLNFSIFNIK